MSSSVVSRPRDSTTAHFECPRPHLPASPPFQFSQAYESKHVGVAGLPPTKQNSRLHSILKHPARLPRRAERSGAGLLDRHAPPLHPPPYSRRRDSLQFYITPKPNGLRRRAADRRRRRAPRRQRQPPRRAVGRRGTPGRRPRRRHRRRPRPPRALLRAFPE